MQHTHGPAKVVILGHSYVHRLSTFMSSNTHYDNLSFNRQEVVVRCLGVSGGTLRRGHRSVQRTLSCVVLEHPDIVIVHIGENDLHVLSAEKIAQGIIALVGCLSVIPGIQQVIISQLLPFPVHYHIRDKVVAVNKILQERCSDPHGALYWRHRGGFWKTQHLYGRDRVHLSPVGMHAYWRSLRAAISRTIRLL